MITLSNCPRTAETTRFELKKISESIVGIRFLMNFRPEGNGCDSSQSVASDLNDSVNSLVDALRTCTGLDLTFSEAVELAESLAK